MRLNAALLLLIPVSHMSAEETKPALDAQQEKIVRESVYDSNPRLESPKRDFQSILVIPTPLADVYKEKPQAVLDLLLKIMEGASPKDSALAAGYALALLDGPGGGVVCVEHFDKAIYGVVDKDWKITPRAHWVQKVKTKMKSVTAIK